MRDKLEQLIKNYEDLEKRLYDPAVVSDPKEYARLAKERSSQAPLVEKSREYVGALDDIDAARELMKEESDPDVKAMLQEEVEANQAKLPELEEEIKIMLIPGDPNDEKNTIVEIRAGVGGDEAAIFAGDIYSMYRRLADRKGWKIRSCPPLPPRRAATRPSSSRFPATRCTPS